MKARSHSNIGSRLRAESLEERVVPSGYPLPVGATAIPAATSLLVRFDDGLSASAREAVGSGLGHLEIAPDGTSARLELDPGVNPASALEAIRAASGVLYAEPEARRSALVTPNDPQYASEWGLNNTNNVDIDAPEAWDITKGNASTLVAVIDTGISFTHPDLVDRIWTNPGEIAGNGVDDDNDGYVDDVRGWNFVNDTNNPADDHGHGTHVSGTIAAATNNALGVAGINWNAKILPLKFLDASGNGDDFDAAAAIRYAANVGAKVINASWGGGDFSQTLLDAIDYARSKGVVFVAAAGNGAANTDTTPFYPASYDLANIISVAAVASNGALASFSNYGANSVDVAAPGVGIISTVRGGGYGSSSGTSMAAPHVAGVISLLAGMNPTLDPASLIARVMSSTKPLASLAGKTVSGGIVSAARALSQNVAKSYDFGPASSPVASGFTGVSTGAYTAAAGFGWQGGTTTAKDRGTADPLTRDFVYTTGATFLVDLPNGTYDVTVTLGDALFAHDLQGVFLEGTKVDTVTTAGGQSARRTYRVTVADGQLSLGLFDQGGSDPNVCITALEIATASPSLWVTGSSAGGTASASDRVRFSFSQDVKDGTFTLDDVVSIVGPNGAIAPTAVNRLDARTYEVVFPSQSTPGSYSVTIGPAIAGLDGRNLDQDHDGQFGETPDDRYTAAFTLTAGSPRNYDFGPVGSPVASGFTGVATGAYTAAAGFGWQGGTTTAKDRGTADPLTRDFVYTTGATFLVDLPNGTYDVTVTLGDALFAHDLQGVFLEGTKVDTVTTAGGQSARRTYRVTVADGQLSLGLFDQGGSDPNVCIAALEIASVPAGGGVASVDELPSPSPEKALTAVPASKAASVAIAPPADVFDAALAAVASKSQRSRPIRRTA